MRWLIVLALVGCANKADLYEAAKACGTVSECPEEWEKWDNSVRSSREREELQCPKDTVKYSDHHGEVSCVTRESIREFLLRIERGY